MVKIISASAPWRVSIYFRWPESGRAYRERRFVPDEVTARSNALRWAQSREAALLRAGEAAIVAPVASTSAPTLRAFGPRWIEGHCEALRQKKSGIDAKKYALKNHLYPAFGDLRLDEITTERVARFCAGLQGYSRKTVGNILVTLAKILRTAVEWDVIRAMPCKIKVPKSTRTPPTFYERDAMRSLIGAAAAIGSRSHVRVLLGLHAGLRRGEMLGLEWSDVSLPRRQIVIRRNAISKYVDTPKSGHGRVIDLSAELADALARLHDVTPSTTGRVLLQDSGKPALARHLYAWIEAARVRADSPSARAPSFTSCAIRRARTSPRRAHR
jgi:integrase